MTKEIWKPAVGFEGYEVSNLGRVRSYWYKRWGKLMDESQRILSSQNKSRYASVHLRGEGKYFFRRVHNLVAEAFLGPCPVGMIVCHIDDDGHNNHLSNLRYDTQKNNLATLRCRKLMQKAHRLFDEAAIIEIRTRYFDGEIAPDLADEFNCVPGTIYQICVGNIYAEFGGPTGLKQRSIPDDDVLEMRRLRWKEDIGTAELARRFGLYEGTVSQIINFKKRIATGGPGPAAIDTG